MLSDFSPYHSTKFKYNNLSVETKLHIHHPIYIRTNLKDRVLHNETRSGSPQSGRPTGRHLYYDNNLISSRGDFGGPARKYTDYRSRLLNPSSFRDISRPSSPDPVSERIERLILTRDPFFSMPFLPSMLSIRVFSGLSLAPTDNVQSVVGTCCYLFPLPGILYDPPMLILRGYIASAATWRQCGGNVASTWNSK